MTFGGYKDVDQPFWRYKDFIGGHRTNIFFAKILCTFLDSCKKIDDSKNVVEEEFC